MNDEWTDEDEKEFGGVRMLIFDMAWEDLADEGVWHGRDGAEYRRVRREWLLAGRTLRVRHFIRDRVNIDSHGRTPAENGQSAD